MSLTLPAVTIGFYLAPVLLRSLRASLIETLSAEFIEAARARGLSESRVLLKHVLRNSLIVMTTVLGVNIGEEPAWTLNTDAHLRSALIGRSESIPIVQAKLELGEHGRIYFADFDGTRPRTRIVRVQVVGE